MKIFLFSAIILISNVSIIFGQGYETELLKADEYFAQVTAESYQKAINIYIKYETDLSAVRINNLGMCFWIAKEYEPALKFFELAASKGLEAAKFNAGFNYFYGNGTIKDLQKSYNYLVRLSSELNSNSETLHMLGHCVEGGADLHGKLGEPNYQAARAYFISAAEKGNADCMVHLGDYYNNSGKINNDYTEAKEWYTKACEEKNVDACNKLEELNEIFAKQKMQKQDKVQNSISSEKKKSGDGFSKILNVINEGIGAYNNSKNGINNTINSSVKEGAWSSWVQNECYKGLFFRVKKERFTQGKWTLVFQIKSTYNRKVFFSGRFISTDIDVPSPARWAIEANYVPEAGARNAMISSNGSKITIEIGNVCFDKYDECCKYSDCPNCFALPDNGTPNIPTQCGSGINTKCVSVLNVS